MTIIEHWSNNDIPCVHNFTTQDAAYAWMQTQIDYHKRSGYYKDHKPMVGFSRRQFGIRVTQLNGVTIDYREAMLR